MTFDELFALTPDGSGRWIGPAAPLTDERMVFGGLVIGQALVAASSQARRCHALHAFFIGMGAKQEVFEIAVKRTRDGGSFDTRHFEITQAERILLAGFSSHHDGNEGPEHEVSMPDAPPPETVEDYSVIQRRLAAEQARPMKNYLFASMLDLRHVQLPYGASPREEIGHATWFRARSPIVGTNRIHQAAIGFASDVGLVHAGLHHHPHIAGELQTASLDHSIWFHRDARADEWMLHVMRSPVARDGRGLSQGSIFNSQGQLVASTAQEFLARKSKTKK